MRLMLETTKILLLFLKMNNYNSQPLDATLDYDRTNDRFVRFRIPAPFSVCYKVTQRCNLRCPYCIASSCPEGEYGLPTDKALKLIEILARSGVRRLDITGGEPFLRDDIMDILESAVIHGLETVVTTNGYFVTEGIATELHRLGVFTQISIDGDREIMDKVRGNGAYSAAVSAAEILVKSSVGVRINCVLHKLSHLPTEATMTKIVELARHLGVPSIYFIVVCGQGRAGLRADKICFNMDQEAVVRSQILAYRKLHPDIKIKMLDFRQYARACVLVDTMGEFISQGWSDDDCIYTGNVLEDSIQSMWESDGSFDHALHLLQYIRHPLLYQ
jgi:MoaA/NifB/PqqE/SkfB family radical SAM enzyme